MRVLWSPMRYYRERLALPPHWASAVAPLAIEAAALMAGFTVLFVRMEPALSTGVLSFILVIFVFSTIFAIGFAFGLYAGIVVAIHRLGTGSTAGAGRLVEFSALAHWSEVPWIVVYAAWMAWALPPVLDLNNAAQVEESLRTMPVGSLALQLLGAGFGVWLVVLQACALRVASGFTVTGASVAAAVLGIIFVAIPWIGMQYL